MKEKSFIKLILLGSILVIFVVLVGGAVLSSLTCPRPSGVKPAPELTITTDKTEYEQGETVKITVRNNLEEDICYLSYQGSECYRTPHAIYQFSEGEWKSVPIGLPLMCPQVEAPPVCNRLGPNEEKVFIWDQKILDWATESRNQAPAGKYKVSINYKEGTEEIKLGDTKEIKTIYSNEFAIKEK